MKDQPAKDRRRVLVQDPSSLYLIATQGTYTRAEFLGRVESAIEGGVDLVQMREKSMDAASRFELAQDLHALCRNNHVPLIINDDAELARRINADGLHVGQDDLPPAEARAIIGEEMLLGLSTHDMAQVEAAMADSNVDMLGFGPVFTTTTKDAGAPRGTSLLAQIIAGGPQKPVWAIGGISLENLGEVVAVECHRIAVSSALMQAEDARARARELKAGLTKS